MERLGIKNKTQIKIWMRWYKTGQTHHFSQRVGKQYSYGKEVEELGELEQLRLKNKQLEAELDILKKYREIERAGAASYHCSINNLSATYRVKEILAILEIPKATYYRWKKKFGVVTVTPLEELVMQLREENSYHYGHRKITAILRRKYGIHKNRKTIQRMMQKIPTAMSSEEEKTEVFEWRK